jgi:predicted house-cleaning NTP pyrophosphatase (Maf/HAM1 superfamily)
MSFAFVQHLKNKRIILASGSPRRQEILSRLGLNFDVVPSKFPETLDKAKYTPSEYAIANATEKGLEVYGRLMVRILNITFISNVICIQLLLFVNYESKRIKKLIL